MGSNSLAARSGGQTVEADDVNQYRNALMQDHLPRNASGAVEDEAGNLGSPSAQWSSLYVAGQVVVDGSVIDFSAISSEGHQILSGAEATSSGGYPDFLDFVASTTTARIAGATTALSVVINGASVTISSNVDVTGCTTAPSSNNTCAINDPSMADDEFTKTWGENGEYLLIDTVGSEISDRNGEVHVFKKGSEYFLALIDTSNNRLWPFKRGVARTDRETLLDNDTITLMQGNYIFLDSDGTTTYKTTIFPTARHEDVGSTSNEWYFNTDTKRWRRYSGSWSNMSAHLLGFVICDATYCVAAHPLDFDLGWSDNLHGDFHIIDADTIQVELRRADIAGVSHSLDDFGRQIQLSASGDRESGTSETASTKYYIYADKALELKISDIAPRPHDKRLGKYHPKRYWRYLGYIYNDSGSDISKAVFDGMLDHDVERFPTKFKAGPPIEYVSATEVKIPADFMCRDDADEVNIVVDADITIDISDTPAVGAVNRLMNGLTESSDDWYYIWIISKANGKKPAGLLTEDSTGISSMPTGYTHKRLLGSVRNDGSGDFIPFKIGAGWPYRPEVHYLVESTEFYSGWTNGPTNVLSAGTATTATDIDLSDFVPATSERAILNALVYGNTSFGHVEYNTKSGTEKQYFMSGSSGAVGSCHVFQLQTDASKIVQYKNTNMISSGLDVKGYVEGLD